MRDMPIKYFVQVLLDLPILKQIIIRCLTLELHNTVRHMTNRKHGKVSELMKKDFDNLQNFSWDNLVMEMRRDMPLLFQCCVAIMSNPRDTCKVPHLQQIMPKLGMI